MSSLLTPNYNCGPNHEMSDRTKEEREISIFCVVNGADPEDVPDERSVESCLRRLVKSNVQSKGATLQEVTFSFISTILLHLLI